MTTKKKLEKAIEALRITAAMKLYQGIEETWTEQSRIVNLAKKVLEEIE
jgi:hypothetical protein